MTKLQQLAKALTRLGLLYRQQMGTPPTTTYRMEFESSVAIVIWNGPTDPVAQPGMQVNHFWFDGQVFQKRIGSQWVLVDTYEQYFPTTLLYTGDLFDQVNRFIVSVTIAGPKTVPSDKNHLMYRLMAKWSDGATETVAGTWAVAPAAPDTQLPNGCSIVTAVSGNGILRSGTSALNRNVVITATHGSFSSQFNATVLGTETENLGKATLSISGPLNVMEAMAAQYTARITFPNGLSETPAQSLFDWTVTPDNKGTISANGLFTASNVAQDTNVIVSARLREANELGTATKTVTVRESTISATSAPFYGTGAAGANSANFILSLANRANAGSRQSTFSLTASGNEKIYYAYPASLGVATFANSTTNTAGGFDIGVTNGIPRTVSVPDGSGGNVDFYLYESNAAGMGTVTIVVS